ncbi:hypothetical protein ANN_17889 [Periplaneta americana]|uniref:Per a allergen n=1 Tax=Periplaneta americana TaxID=6978 RepID=A0ABQ8SU65_PERAM|nr:hypothetical protein ANN_17889 [Periplaneta americana]
MAEICEGGNEPLGSLKAISKDVLATWLNIFRGYNIDYKYIVLYGHESSGNSKKEIYMSLQRIDRLLFYHFGVRRPRESNQVCTQSAFAIHRKINQIDRYTYSYIETTSRNGSVTEQIGR